MCYDSGHENFLTPHANFLQKHGDRLMCVHLHDNNGLTDQHKIPFTGSVNWEYVALSLASTNINELIGEVKLNIIEGVQINNESDLIALLKQIYDSLNTVEKMMQIK